MKGLILGIDLCDDYSQVGHFDTEIMDAVSMELEEEESGCLIPTVLCKRKGQDQWFIGEEAYRCALNGDGIMVDKLVSLVEQGGMAMIEGRSYEAEKLLERYIAQLLLVPLNRFKSQQIEKIVFSLRELNPVLMDSLIRLMGRLGFKREQIKIIGHTECFLYYVISQQKEIWQNESCLFDLSEDGLNYYELKVTRGRKPQLVEVAHQRLEEGFSLEILESVSGGKMADKILTECGKRLLDKKLVSSVFLTGQGFGTTQWADGFLKFVCNKRRVFAGQNLFAKGAAYVAFDSMQETSSYPYICLCEGRIRSTVYLEAEYEGRKRQIILASAGTNWYEAKAVVELIVDQTDNLELFVATVGSSQLVKLVVPLGDFPARPPKTTRIEVIVAFVKEDSMMVRVIDKGFGDLFAASGREVKQYFHI